MFTKASIKIYKEVHPIKVEHYCQGSFMICLLASVTDEKDKSSQERFLYAGYTVLVNEKFAFDLFGRRIEYGDEIEKVLGVEASGSIRDNILVQKTDGTISWAEVRYNFISGVGGALEPTKFIPPSRFFMRAWLNLCGSSFESIEPLPDDAQFGFATFIGKRDDKYYLLERGTGNVVDFPVDLGEEKARVKVFCSKPVVENGILYADALVHDDIYRFKIDPEYHDGHRLQLAGQHRT